MSLENPREESRKRRKSRLAHAVLVAAGVCIFALAWALVREARGVRGQPIHNWSDDISADCGVVLTGGPNRIREGIDLLSRKQIQKLIISGVHPQAELKLIFPLWPYYGDLNESDVILERRSRTTFGNAIQSLALVEALRCRDVVLITSKAHMPRALRTFRAEFPRDMVIIPRAVVATSVEPGFSELSTEAVKSVFYGLWAY